jgi:phosphate transport system protein
MSNYRLSGYDRALMEIRTMTVELAQAVKSLLSKGLGVLANPSSMQDTDWRGEDNQIDQMRDQVINRILEIMSLQQLRTQDLRCLLGSHRMAQELERIADYACDIAELAGLSSELQKSTEILQMSEQTGRMFDKMLESLQLEEDKVKELDQLDDFLDFTFMDLQKRFVAESQSEKTGSLGFSLILARTMERMGDHILNVAEALVYIKTGEKH